MNVLKTKKDIRKYLGEGLLIVFSVLFALFINKTYEDVKIKADKNNAIKQIKAEFSGNQKILDEWIADHTAILENLNYFIESKNDSILTIARNRGNIPLDVIFDNRSLVDQAFSNSAWSSSQSIGIISEFDFEELQIISETYELQQLIMVTSIEKIADRIFIKINDIENPRDVLIELRIRFQNLLSQEQKLKQLYAAAIDILD